MSTSTKNTNTTAQSTTQKDPWAPTLPALNDVLGQLGNQIPNTATTGIENNALGGLASNAANGNPYAGAINTVAGELLGGGGPDRSGYASQGMDTLRSQLNPIATQSTNPYDNQAFQNLQSTLSGDITNQIKSQYAGAGYSPVSSGDYAQQLGRGISQGIAPAFVDAQNNLTSQRAGAANSLYQGGAQTAGILSGLDQTRLGNQVQGIGASTSALNANDSALMRQLQVAQMQRSLPLANIGDLQSLILPMAQLGGTANQTGTQQSQTTSNPGILGSIGQGIGVLNSGFGLLGW